MHIAFFSDQHPATLGGLQVSVQLQRDYLERLGHRVTVIAPAPRASHGVGNSLEREVWLPAKHVGGHSFTLAGKRYDQIIDAAVARKPAVDLVHIHADVWGAWNGYRFAHRHELPVVNTMHTNLHSGLAGMMNFTALAFPMLYAAQAQHLGIPPAHSVAEYTKAFADRAEQVISPSYHYADQLRGYGIDTEIAVIPTGVDDSKISALRRLSPIPLPKPVLLWAGRVSREKRLRDFLTAFSRAHSDAEVHVYGNGNDLEACRSSAHVLGINPRVRFFGETSHDTVLHAMRHADAVVQSSVGFETQGLTLYEAAALGTPVILADQHIGRDLPPRFRFAARDDSIEAMTSVIEQFTAHLGQKSSSTDPTDQFMQSIFTASTVDLYAQVIRRFRVRQSAKSAVNRPMKEPVRRSSRPT